MGHSSNGSIQNFWPDDTDDEFYLESSYQHSIEDILELAKNKWGDISISDIMITCQNIHTNCITYDLHDPSDYTEFLIISKR